MCFSASSADQRSACLALLDDVTSVTVAARELGINRNTAYTWARHAGVRSIRAPHPARAAYAALRTQGVALQAAAIQVGINVRTARDWDHGVRSSRHSRFYPDGRRVNYATGQTTMESMTSPPPDLARVPRHPPPICTARIRRGQLVSARTPCQSQSWLDLTPILRATKRSNRR